MNTTRRVISRTNTVLPGGGWMRTVRWPNGYVTTEPVVAWEVTVSVYDDGDWSYIGTALDVDPDSGMVEDISFERGTIRLYWHPEQQHETPEWALEMLERRNPRAEAS